MATATKFPVIFWTPDGSQTISFADLDITTVVNAAHRLRAERFLMPEPEQPSRARCRGLVTWGLFETSKCTKYIGGHWSLAVPTNTWDLTEDAVGVLEMYVMHRSAAGG
jgi:hypothetical protein